MGLANAQDRYITAGALVIEDVDWHRNGVSGVGFHVVLFSEPKEERRMMAVVFPLDEQGNGAARPDRKWNGLVSVFNRALLAQDVITFGENSWRGDHYEDDLRQGIALWEAREDAARAEGEAR